MLLHRHGVVAGPGEKFAPGAGHLIERAVESPEEVARFLNDQWEMSLAFAFACNAYNVTLEKVVFSVPRRAIFVSSCQDILLIVVY